MCSSRRQFTREFKLAALQRLETGASAAEVARAFEVNPNARVSYPDEFLSSYRFRVQLERTEPAFGND